MATSPFEVPLGDLKETRKPRRVTAAAPLSEDLVADVDSRVAAGTEVVVDAELSAFDGGVAVTGTVTSTWEGECRRCLGEVGGPLEAHVRELFRRGGGDDEGTYPLGVDFIDLAEMAADSLFAALPLLPLCRADCLGICPTCGSNRNTAPCCCAEVTIDSRWSGLELIKGEVGPVRPAYPSAGPANPYGEDSP